MGSSIRTIGRLPYPVSDSYRAHGCVQGDRLGPVTKTVTHERITLTGWSWSHRGTAITHGTVHTLPLS